MSLGARRLGRIVRRAAALASTGGAAAALGGCCMPYFEEWSPGFSWSRVVAMPPDVASQSPPPDKALPTATCTRLCDGATDACFPATLIGPSGVVSEVVVCNDFSDGHCADTGVFRMPSGRRAAVLRRGEPGAAWLALAGAEAASIDDFRRLARELQRAGAPRRLVTGSLAAAEDEVRHEHVLRGIARRTGALAEVARRGPPRVARTNPRRRDLTSLARENVALGCVGESWGALLLEVQSRASADAAVRRALARIARDEIRHAALAFDLHAWLWQRLDARGRASVRRALARSLAALQRAADIDPALEVALALPAATTRRALAAALTGALRAALADAATGPRDPRRPALSRGGARPAPARRPASPPARPPAPPTTRRGCGPRLDPRPEARA